MIFEGFAVGPIEANCYIVGCERTREAVVVDPGAEGEHILSRLQELDLKAGKIILTHGHGDHIGAVEEVRTATGALVLVHQADADCLTRPDRNLSAFMGVRMEFAPADRLLADGDEIKVGDIILTVLHTPGHTLGGICLSFDHGVLTGDTLFAGSVGRSDFPGGNHTQLIESIKQKLMVLSDDTRVYPGHGPMTTIGAERRENPYL
ncbi:MAG TPA: MBL fold metallo-hydrolase [Spirochaetia bacterium]|nr:MBL fold metallo-hydrolase [Spirochaetia bacterium]